MEFTLGGFRVSGAILGFDGKHRYLSNFHVTPFKYGGRTYLSGEHAFQAAKTDDAAWIEKIRLANSPSQAKRLGRQCPLRADWESVKIDIMRDVVMAKFSQNADLRLKLISTGDAYLEETNTWNDRFWGVCKGKGNNHLGKILMQVREELAKEIPNCPRCGKAVTMRKLDGVTTISCECGVSVKSETARDDWLRFVKHYEGVEYGV